MSTNKPYVSPNHELIEISHETSELIDITFGEMMDEYISESGMKDEYDFDVDTYLETFSQDHKISYIIKNRKYL